VKQIGGQKPATGKIDAYYRKALQRAVEKHGPQLEGLRIVERWRENGRQVIDAQKKARAEKKEKVKPENNGQGYSGAVDRFKQIYIRENGKPPSDVTMDNFASLVAIKMKREQAMG